MDDEELKSKIELLRERRRGKAENKKAVMPKSKIAEVFIEDEEDDYQGKYSLEKKAYSTLDIILFQCILAVMIAIIYICVSMYYKPQAQQAMILFKEKLSNGFSFQEQVYDTIGEVITYLNSISPIENGGEPSGQGGIYTPVKGNKLPQNATFAPVIYTGSISMPLQESTLTSEFGFRTNPIVKKPDFHNALDLAAPSGTAIHAAANGIVIKSEADKSLGNYIQIYHGHGFVTTYGHCDKLIATVGMRVREGEIIAKVGSTGDSTGPHVHFAAQMDGIYFDPAYLFNSTRTVLMGNKL